MEQIKPKIVDAFYFYNELDLLEIRLNILDPYVDLFILSEARYTFSGLEKPLYFQENKERYSKFLHKIVYNEVEEGDEQLWAKAVLSPNVGRGEHWWVREFYQKESIEKPIKKLHPSDIIFLSDLDEIWNPQVLNGLHLLEKYPALRPIQKAYHYYLNNASNQDIGGWTGTRVGTVETLLKKGPNHFRTERETKSHLLENGGWHFSNLGDTSFIQKKMQSYGHQEHNNSTVLDRVGDCIKNNVDFLGRGFTLFKSEEGLPEYILKSKEKYNHLFL